MLEIVNDETHAITLKLDQLDEIIKLLEKGDKKSDEEKKATE